MADPARARKLADRIQEIVARMLESRVKDPRLGFVTVTDARVTGDLQHATVFYTVYGSDEDRASTAAALASAKGLIRSEVGKQTGLRLTPSREASLSSDKASPSSTSPSRMARRSRSVTRAVNSPRGLASTAMDLLDLTGCQP